MNLKIKIRKWYLHDLIIAITFLLLCRPIAIYPFVFGGYINSIFVLFSKIIFIIILLLFSKKINRFKKGILLNIIILYICYALSTFKGGGDFRRLIMSLYPNMGIAMLVILECKSYRYLCRFVGVISRLFNILIIINFFLLPFSETMFDGKYFLGIENQIGYGLLIGILFTALDYKLNNRKILFYTYLVLCFTTILYIFSASNVVGAGIIFLYLIFPIIKKIVNERGMKFFLIFYICFFVAIVFFSIVILNWEPIKYFIENILGKNTTLTNRTEIWRVALSKIKEHPILGYGIRNTTNLFYIHLEFTWRATVDGTYSAHNQWIQTLYEGE